MVSDSDSLFHNNTEDLTTTFHNGDRSVIRLGIVGHRYLNGGATISFVMQRCTAILKQARSEYQRVVALSAIAEGADTLFAEAALALDIPLEIVRPFDDYASDFETAASRARYEKLRTSAKNEVGLNHNGRSDEAYKDAMTWIVGHSDLLVVVWDGLPAEGAGGTGDAVKQVVQLGKSWWHLDVTDLSVNAHMDTSITRTEAGS